MQKLIKPKILCSPLSDDVPRAFSYNDSLGQLFHSGPYYHLISNFAKLQHYNLKLDQVDNLKTLKILQNIEQGVYNLSLHGTVYSDSRVDLEYSYPIEWTHNCIMVPLEDELPKFLYVIWPYGRWIWLTSVLGVVYIAFLMRLINNRARGVTRSVISNIITSAAILLYCSNMNVRLRNTSIRLMFFYGLLLLLGFILSAYYLPYVTAYCMKPIFFEPFNTVADLLKYNIKVMVAENDIALLERSLIYNQSGLGQLVEIVSRKEILRNLRAFDRHYAYLMAEDQWKFLQKQQGYLKKPYFHWSDICFHSTFLSIPMQMNVSYADDLNRYLLYIKEAGLWHFWECESFVKAVSADLAKILIDIYPVEPLNLAFFKIGWMVLAAGLTASCFSLLMELYVHRYYHRADHN